MSNSAFAIAFAGGVVAQVPDPIVGNAGLIVGVVSLIAGCFKAWLEYKQQMKRMDIQESKTEGLATSLKAAEDKAKALEMSLANTAQELADARDRNHRFQNHTNNVLTDVQGQVLMNQMVVSDLIPATKELASQSGISVAIPDPPLNILEAKPCPAAQNK